MKIAKYIGDLIFDYECVVIPGLGGFISTEESASINATTNQFSPPYKQIRFNIHLKANDGLLVNYVSKNEGLSYKSGKQKVDKFALLCHKALKDGKRINFNKIGYLFLDANENIVFKQEKTINYNADSFGLSSFVSPAIRRPNVEEKIKEAFSVKKEDSGKTPTKSSPKRTKSSSRDRRVSSESQSSMEMPSRKKPSKVMQQLLFVFIILFAMGTYYVVNNRHAMGYYIDRYKVSIPFLYSNPSDYLVANAGLIPLDKISVSQAGWLSNVFGTSNTPEAQPSTETDEENNTIIKPIIVENSILDNNERDKDAEILVEEEPEVIKAEFDTYTINPGDAEPEVKPNNDIVKVKPKPVRTYSNGNFYIIAGSFKSRRNAEKLVSDLSNQGFDALIADTNSYGMFRVAYMSFGNLNEAENSLVAVRRDTNPQAWVLKK